MKVVYAHPADVAAADQAAAAIRDATVTLRVGLHPGVIYVLDETSAAKVSYGFDFELQPVAESLIHTSSSF